MTRIISSGVTPFATAAATNEPALVPTYTSNWFTVRFTESRSSARSAPISYTPPGQPPPPSTSAVFERGWRRRAPDPREVVPVRSAAAASRLTTLPILRTIVRRVGTGSGPGAMAHQSGPHRYFDRGPWLYPPMRVFLATLGAITVLLAGTAAAAGAQVNTAAQER